MIDMLIPALACPLTPLGADQPDPGAEHGRDSMVIGSQDAILVVGGRNSSLAAGRSGSMLDGGQGSMLVGNQGSMVAGSRDSTPSCSRDSYTS